MITHWLTPELRFDKIEELMNRENDGKNILLFLDDFASVIRSEEN